jgi:uncharacterized membrane protein
MPTFAHVSLILAPDKSKLSKRHGATSVGQVHGLVKRLYSIIFIIIVIIFIIIIIIIIFIIFFFHLRSMISILSDWVLFIAYPNLFGLKALLLYLFSPDSYENL